jgi:small subunit ribosomal protein S16
VAVKIKLKRMGKIRNPQYRIIVADARTKRDGRAIEQIGKYHPKEEPSLIQVDSDRAQYWLGVGAQPTEPVLALLKVTGDWQKYKGLPGAEGTLRVKEPKADKRERFDAALAEAHADPKSEATTPRKRAAKKAAAKAEPTAAGKPAKADKPAKAKADTAKADTAKADTAKADTAKADTAKADTAEKPAAAAETGAASAIETDTAPTAEA